MHLPLCCCIAICVLALQLTNGSCYLLQLVRLTTQRLEAGGGSWGQLGVWGPAPTTGTRDCSSQCCEHLRHQSGFVSISFPWL